MKRIRLMMTAVFVTCFLCACNTGPSKSTVYQAPQVNAANELAALGRLRSLATSEISYKAQTGQYGTLEELINQGYVADPSRGKLTGYNFAIRVTADGFQITAVPDRYGVTGLRSFFVDESNVTRAADKKGAAATPFDPPEQG
jgi:hypothetical protein